MSRAWRSCQLLRDADPAVPPVFTLVFVLYLCDWLARCGSFSCLPFFFLVFLERETCGRGNCVPLGLADLGSGRHFVASRLDGRRLDRVRLNCGGDAFWTVIDGITVEVLAGWGPLSGCFCGGAHRDDLPDFEARCLQTGDGFKKSSLSFGT